MRPSSQPDDLILLGLGLSKQPRSYGIRRVYQSFVADAFAIVRCHCRINVTHDMTDRHLIAALTSNRLECVANRIEPQSRAMQLERVEKLAKFLSDGVDSLHRVNDVRLSSDANGKRWTTANGG